MTALLRTLVTKMRVVVSYFSVALLHPVGVSELPKLLEHRPSLWITHKENGP
jgi:hypothetical protein